MRARSSSDSFGRLIVTPAGRRGEPAQGLAVSAFELSSSRRRLGSAAKGETSSQPVFNLVTLRIEIGGRSPTAEALWSTASAFGRFTAMQVRGGRTRGLESTWTWA
jgi:hypothetical protein